MKPYDAVIIGGGIMGCLAAYEITRAGGTVAIIERDVIGNGKAGSSGLTRSLRTDYDIPQYANLAAVAWDKWQVLQDRFGVPLVTPAGCLNLAVQSQGSYARYAADWLKRDEREYQTLRGEAVKQRFPQFAGFDYAVFEPGAGLGFPQVAMQKLRQILEAEDRCDIYENVELKRVICTTNDVTVYAQNGDVYRASSLVAAAALGTPGVLAKIAGCGYRLPLVADRPADYLYYTPQDAEPYMAARLPVFACLDEGIYGHPIVQGKTTAVKVGYHNPPTSIRQGFQASEANARAFMERYMPGLVATATIAPVKDVDQCAYDMTPDGGFAIGTVPGYPQVFVAAGFCGTGYKFAPVVAEVIADFVAGKSPRYDISVFNPARFTV